MKNTIEELSKVAYRLEGKMDLVVTSISDLSASFRELEQGRLSRLEVEMANTQIKIANIQGRFFAYSISASIAASIILFLLNHYLK